MTSERIYKDDSDQWFYSRRGEHAGPFASHADAERALRLYLRKRKRAMNVDLVGTSVGLVKSMLRRIAA